MAQGEVGAYTPDVSYVFEGGPRLFVAFRQEVAITGSR
jgi:hypothetical protein